MKRLRNMLSYWYWWQHLSLLEDKISLSFLQDFNKTKRLTLWYIAAKRAGASDSIDYAFFKVYHLWGIDGLTEKEKEGF